jgi:hypothetical protein
MAKWLTSEGAPIEALVYGGRAEHMEGSESINTAAAEGGARADARSSVEDAGR